MPSKSATKLNLSQGLKIRDNMYRSSSNANDYEGFEIELRILELTAKKDEKLLKKSLLSQIVDKVEEYVSLAAPSLPPTPEQEGIDAALDWQKSSPYWHPTFNDEVYTNTNGGLVSIPSIILGF